MKQKLIFHLIFCIIALPLFAQKGFIYVHLRNVNEESTPVAGISFSITGTSTPPLTNFTLNDQPAVVNYMYDIGASHGTSTTGGDGELWVVTKAGASASGDGMIYRRKPTGSTWDSIGVSATAVDGVGVNQCVYVTTAGYAYYYNAGTVTKIWDPTSITHLGNKAVDICYGDGVFDVVGSDGNLYKNLTLTSGILDLWVSIISPGNIKRCDAVPSTGVVVYTTASGSVSLCTLLGVVTATLGNPTGGTSANYDVACSDDGTVYAIGSNKCCYYYNTSNSTWTADPSGQNLNCITGGPLKQVWSTTQWNYSYMQQTIYTRTNCGLSYSSTSTFATSGVAVWLDDERARTTYNDNAIIIPVDAGTYTITETVAAGWCIQGIDLYDPTSNSTCSPGAGTITINVAAGEVVHAVVRNEELVATSMYKQCTSNQVVENFDTITVSLPVTCYHWNTNDRTDCGHYNVGTISTGWPNATLHDHTSGSGKFLMVNASYQQDEFYRKRMINLVPGCYYSISFWAINLSGGVSANIIYGINDSLGVVLSDSVTGSIANDLTWHQYTFNFTATTTVADVFLQNSATAGGGCGFGLDDITLCPLATPITQRTVYPSICSNASATFSITPSGGLWSCNKTSILTVDVNLGILHPVATGSAVVNYAYTNQFGCITDTAILVTVNASPKAVATIQYGGSIFKGATVCKGSTDSLFCTQTGGTAPCTYRWSCSNVLAGLAGLLTQNTYCNPTTAGTYIDTVTVTDANGCTAWDTTSVVVSNHVQPIISISTGGTNCTAATVNLNASVTSGGTAPYTYNWSCGQTGNGLVNVNLGLTTAVPTSANSYTYAVNVTDANNCLAVANTTIAVSLSPSVSVGFAGNLLTLCTNGIISLSANVSGGTLPYTGYNWTCTPPANANLVSAVLQTTVAKPSISGNYTFNVSVTDSKGCTAIGTTGSISVNINSSLIAPTVGVSLSTPTSCANSSTTAITLTNSSLTGGVAPYTYAWSGPSGCTFASPTTANTTSSAVSSGNFLLTVTDANGCIGAGLSANLTINALPVVTATAGLAVLCVNDLKTTLAAIATGGSGSGYNSWSWTCSRTDGGIGSASSQSTTCTPGTKSSSGTSYTYSCTAKDGNGCTSLPGTVLITNRSSSNPSVTISPSVGAKICGTTVSLSNITTAGLSPYTYAWTGSNIADSTQSSTTATPLTTGLLTYGLTVKDANSCATTVSAGITLYAALKADVQVSTLNFCGGSLALSLFANASGGAGVYTYSWASASTGNGLGLTNLANTTALPTAVAGSSLIYNVTVNDASGCSVTAAASAVLVLPSPTVSVAATVATPCIGQTISLTASPGPGATSPYIYAWTAPTTATLINGTSQNASCVPLSAGLYLFAVLALDANNCSVVADASLVTIYTLPSINVSVNKLSVCANPLSTINLNATPSGGCGSYRSYAWTGPGCTNSTTSTPTNTAQPTISGQFGVSVTDNNGCLSPVSLSANVSVDLALPSISLNCGTNSNGINYAALYEGNGVNWLWTTTSGGRFYTSTALSVNTDSVTSTLQVPYVTYMGNYAVKITDASGCIGSGTLSILPNSCNTILAISQLDFAAQKQAEDVLLTWSTATETNNNHFNIERSADGITWQVIGTVKGQGNSTTLTNYSFNDNLPLNGANYYRLGEVDDNGLVAYSIVKEVQFAGEWLVKLYPNPAQEYVSLDFNNAKDEKADIVIRSATGGTVFTTQQQLVKGFNHITLNQIQPLAQGVYIIQLITTDNIYKTKFIKAGK